MTLSHDHEEKLTDEDRLHRAPSQIAACRRFRDVLEVLDGLITPQPGAATNDAGEPLPPYPPVITPEWGTDGWPDDNVNLVGPLVFAIRRWIASASELCDPSMAELGATDGATWRRGEPGSTLMISAVVSGWLSLAQGTDEEKIFRALNEGADDWRAYADAFAREAGEPISPMVRGFMVARPTAGDAPVTVPEASTPPVART